MGAVYGGDALDTMKHGYVPWFMPLPMNLAHWQRHNGIFPALTTSTSVSIVIACREIFKYHPLIETLRTATAITTA
jgi:hypothetical protein